MERAGFLKRRESKGGVGLGLGLDSGGSAPWAVLKKQLNLIVDSSVLNSQVDISYVTAGYAPLLVRADRWMGQQCRARRQAQQCPRGYAAAARARS